jgi:predicted nuclease of restriction endonuclease-like RecB superfamily
VLTGRLVRVRFARDRIIPVYLNASDPAWLEIAQQLLELFREQVGHTRGELEDELRETFGDDPTQLVHQGLAKLLEDRCEFEVVSGHPPEQLRELVFRAAAASRAGEAEGASAERQVHPHFHRGAVLQEVADALGLTPDAVEQGLFADLKSEQRLLRFKELSAERLLHRYNMGLAQAVVLRSTKVEVLVRGEPPRRLRQLLRQAKFHRLVCEVQRTEADAYHFHLDGPLSLFTATQKYGLQLALFLPAVLLCRDYELHAELLWGPQRRPKSFRLTAADGLVSDYPDTGAYVPVEISMFADLFRKKVPDWEISEEVEIIPLGDSFWVPDYQLRHRASGKTVYLEILGFWRRASVERHLERLRQHATEPFLLAVSDQLRVDDADLAGLPASIHRFRQMPHYDEIARLAEQLV